MFVVSRPGGRWELRESAATPAGPRARTLASFRVLTPAKLAQAQRRAARPAGDDAVRALARRAGAPVAQPAAERAARELLAELGAGRAPSQPLRRLLAGVLRGGELPDSARWIGATPAQRGAALRDLLLLADRLPAPPRAPARRFGVVRST